MADTAIAITAGTGTNVDTRTEGTNGNHRQVIVIGDPATNAGVAPVDATNGLAVQVIPALPAGTNAIGKLAANSGVDIGDVDVTSVIAGTGATNLGKAEDAAHSSGDTGVMILAVRQDSAAALAGTTGDYIPLTTTALGSLRTSVTKADGTVVDPVAAGTATMSGSVPVTLATDDTRLKQGLYNKNVSAAFTTLTRPANTTAYSAGDSISDNATAGSVTALSATVSDVNDDPIFIADILINSTDTGLAGKKLRANVFNSNPTSSSGVGGGDNAAYSQKKAGYIGTFVGTLETGFSDGTVGRLIPSFRDTNYTPAGGFILTVPTSGARTLYIQYVAEEAFTPSANSTTIIATARGWQARAA